MKRFFFSLILLFFLIPSVFAQQGLQKIRIERWEGGMVSNFVDTAIEQNQGASMLNVVLSKFGEVSTRKGQGLFANDVGNTAFTGLGRFDPDKTTSYVVAASGTAVIQAQAADTEWTLTSPTSVLTSGQTTEFIQANDLLFVLNGFDQPHYWDGASFKDTGPYPSFPPVSTTGAWLRNYLFLAGATDNEDWVYVSNNLDPLTFDVLDIIKVNTGDGQAIQHLEPYRLNELIAYKQRSIFVIDITGDPPSTCTTNCWTVQPISTVVGTIAPRSVVSLGNDQWFLSSEPIAVRSLRRTEFDKILVDIVSRPIQDIFDGTSDEFAINKTHISKAAGVLFDNKFLLAFPSGTSTVNNTVAVYDFITQGWYLITGWFPADWTVFDNRLFYIDANDGRVIECFTGTTGDFAEGPNFIDSSSDPSVGINFQVITKGLEFDFPENFKTLDAIEVEFGATGNYTAEVSIGLDESDYAEIGTVNLAGDSRTLPAGLPFALSTAGVARKTFQTQQYGEFKKLNVKISNSASQETVNLRRISPFVRVKPWRRE